MLLLLAFLCLAGSLTLAGQLVTAPRRQRQESLRRARAYSDPDGEATERSMLERLSERYGDRLAHAALRFDPRANEEKVGERLVASGLARTFSPVEFLAAGVVLGAIGVVLGGLIGVLQGSTAESVLLAVMFGAVGYFALDVLVTLRTRGRRDEMRRDLPGALDVLAVSVEAGLGFDGALAKLSEHKEGPLVEQFELVLNELSIGESRSSALRRLADRVNIAELSSVVSSLIQSEQLGTPLGLVLRTQASESRNRRRVAAEERAAKAPVKMIVPTGIFIFPAVFIVIIGPAMITIFNAFKH
jgi:tight adherence protein C